jgi:hypothetical protein
MRIVLASLILSALAACTTGPNPEDEVRAKAWSQVVRETDVTDVGNGRLRIAASTAFAAREGALEADLLARASGEALRRGAPRFAIVFLKYDDSGLGDLLMPSFADAERGWIGTYEDLLATRADVDPDGSLDGRYGFKRMTAVVRLLAADEEAGRSAFDADGTYVSLLADRAERRRIRPSRRLDLPGLGG